MDFQNASVFSLLSGVLVAVLASGALLLMPAHATSAQAVKRCPTNGSLLPGNKRAVVVKKNKRLVIVREKGNKNSETYGCAFQARKLVPLGADHYGDAWAFGGNMVAVTGFYEGGEAEGILIRVFSLTKGSRLYVVDNDFSEDDRTIVGKVLVTPRGSTAWMEQSSDDDPTPTFTVVVREGSRKKGRDLDSATTIDPDNFRLSLNGRRVVWFKDGRKLSAPLL